MALLPNLPILTCHVHTLEGGVFIALRKRLGRLGRLGNGTLDGNNSLPNLSPTSNQVRQSVRAALWCGTIVDKERQQTIGDGAC
jgi:hypothetical protein